MANNYTQFSFMLPFDGKNLDTAMTTLERFAEQKDEEEDWVGFEYEKTTDGIWINSGPESGDPDSVMDAVQYVLRSINSSKGIWFSWSNTCSKLRLDEFGGGGAVVTARSCFFTTDWDCKRDADAAGIEIL